MGICRKSFRSSDPIRESARDSSRDNPRRPFDSLKARSAKASTPIVRTKPRCPKDSRNRATRSSCQRAPPLQRWKAIDSCCEQPSTVAGIRIFSEGSCEQARDHLAHRTRGFRPGRTASDQGSPRQGDQPPAARGTGSRISTPRSSSLASWRSELPRITTRTPRPASLLIVAASGIAAYAGCSP